MGTAAYDLEQHIAQERRNLDANIDELTTRARRATDWRYQFNQRPFMLLGAAFAGGVMAAMLTSNPRRHHWADGATLNRGRSSHGRSHQWDAIKAALIGAAGHQVRSLFASAIPHFDREYREAERKTRERSTYAPDSGEIAGL